MPRLEEIDAAEGPSGGARSPTHAFRRRDPRCPGLSYDDREAREQLWNEGREADRFPIRDHLVIETIGDEPVTDLVGVVVRG